MSTQPVSFCVGTGRCGTTFLSKVVGLEPGVASSHERLRLPATFHMYCKWHGIPVDNEGFLIDRRLAVAEDLHRANASFESSALLSHSVLELAEEFDAKFVLLVRSPIDTVASFAARGWFNDAIPWRDTTLPPSIREGVEPRHFFGRNLPRGAEFERFRSLTLIGKVAWFWQARNRAILEQFSSLPRERRTIVRLETLDFERYGTLCHLLGWETALTSTQFNDVVGTRPNAGLNAPIDASTWSALSNREFELEVAPVATALGYQAEVAKVLDGVSRLLVDIGVQVNDVLERLKMRPSPNLEPD